jgi:hypothetical protein
MQTEKRQNPLDSQSFLTETRNPMYHLTTRTFVAVPTSNAHPTYIPFTVDGSDTIALANEVRVYQKTASLVSKCQKSDPRA